MIYRVHLSIKSTKQFFFLQVRQFLFKMNSDVPQKWPEVIKHANLGSIKYIHLGPDLQNLLKLIVKCLILREL